MVYPGVIFWSGVESLFVLLLMRLLTLSIILDTTPAIIWGMPVPVGRRRRRDDRRRRGRREEERG